MATGFISVVIAVQAVLMSILIFGGLFLYWLHTVRGGAEGLIARRSEP